MSRIGSMQSPLAGRRKFDRTGPVGLVARPRLGTGRQLNEPDLFAEFRANRFGRRWRWFNDRRHRGGLHRFGDDFRFWFRRRRGDNDDFFLNRRGLGFFDGGRRRKFGGQIGMFLEQLLFEELGADFVKRAGGDFRGGNAQRLGLGENRFVLQAELFRDVVNPNGHKFSPWPTEMCESPSWLKARKHLFRSAS